MYRIGKGEGFKERKKGGEVGYGGKGREGNGRGVKMGGED